MNTYFRCLSCILFCALILLLGCPSALSEDERIEPAWPVPDYVEYLLQVASEEVGYTEDHGRTKYGAWAGDPAAQWCAEFQCWCVDQVDRRWGTSLLRNVYPFILPPTPDGAGLSAQGVMWSAKGGLKAGDMSG